MTNNEWTIQDEIKDVKMTRPHVVLLGAGASVAALPNGDKNGRKLPVMDNFVHVIGLGPILEKHGIQFKDQNFELLYADMVGKAEHLTAMNEIETCIRDYFSVLELPDHPTVYDHLVLSLREKDFVATFNWDPFLVQACMRNSRFAKMPRTVFLHGCVALGIDSENKIVGPVSKISSKGKPFLPSRILFPVHKKDYNSDPFISGEWGALKKYLQAAYVFSIFGYGAPASDVEAVQLMKKAWGDVNKREYEETEIIDIKSEDELSRNWKQFIHTHHYRVFDDFYTSIVANHPRRSCEAVWNQLMECKWLKPNPLPKDANFSDLYKWFRPFFEAEKV